VIEDFVAAAIGVALLVYLGYALRVWISSAKSSASTATSPGGKSLR
jgi:hypothetical protein